MFIALFGGLFLSYSAFEMLNSHSWGLHYKFASHIFSLTLLCHRFLQKCPMNAGVSQGSGWHLPLLTGWFKSCVCVQWFARVYFQCSSLCALSRSFISCYNSSGDNWMSPVEWVRCVFPPSVKTFCFKLHTGTYPVKTGIQGRGILIDFSVKYLLCSRPETVDHCFVDCICAVFF